MSILSGGLSVRRTGATNQRTTEVTNSVHHDSPISHHDSQVSGSVNLSDRRTVGGSPHTDRAGLLTPPKAPRDRHFDSSEPAHKPVEQTGNKGGTNEQFFQSLRDRFAHNQNGTSDQSLTGRLQDALTGASTGVDLDRLKRQLTGGLISDNVGRHLKGLQDQLVGSGVTGDVSPALRDGLNAFSHGMTGSLFGGLFQSATHEVEAANRLNDFATKLIDAGGYSEDQVANVMQNTLRALLGK